MNTPASPRTVRDILGIADGETTLDGAQRVATELADLRNERIEIGRRLGVGEGAIRWALDSLTKDLGDYPSLTRAVAGAKEDLAQLTREVDELREERDFVHATLGGNDHESVNAVVERVRNERNDLRSRERLVADVIGMVGMEPVANVDNLRALIATLAPNYLTLRSAVTEVVATIEQQAAQLQQQGEDILSRPTREMLDQIVAERDGLIETLTVIRKHIGAASGEHIIVAIDRARAEVPVMLDAALTPEPMAVTVNVHLHGPESAAAEARVWRVGDVYPGPRKPPAYVLELQETGGDGLLLARCGDGWAWFGASATPEAIALGAGGSDVARWRDCYAERSGDLIIRRVAN